MRALRLLALSGLCLVTGAAGDAVAPEELRVRVGLATDLATVTFPCCDPRAELVAGGERLNLGSQIRVEPAAAIANRAVYRLQVAALKDEQQAQGIADYLGRTTGHPTDSVFDAGTDLYRVRCGRFATREEAERERGRLAGLGVTDAWIASEGGELTNPALRIFQNGRELAIVGRWLAVTASPDSGVALSSGRYRGAVLVYLNDRGRLNLINELPLEDYLRSVVPREMGPELYNQLEALKAQAVAARTFTVRNLGEFASEGYDICSTPRCQVYGGMAAEHPISDRAIAETRGQLVLFHDTPAETFYSATCGGHTESVEVVFPLKRGDYLRGVPCLEAGTSRLAGNLPASTLFPAGLTRVLLPPAAGKPPRVLSARLEHLALLAGLPVPDDRLRSTDRSEVLRFLGSVFDVALDRRLLGSRDKLGQLLAAPPADWRGKDLAFATYLAGSGLLGGAPEAPLGDAEIEELLFQLALYTGVLERQELHFLGLAGGQLTVRSPLAQLTYELPGSLATFRRDRGTLRAESLLLMAGDRLEVYVHRERLLAVVQPFEPRPVDFGKRAARQRWSRFMTRGELRRAVQSRYPGFPFEGFEVVDRGVSGRVRQLRLLGSSGRQVEVEGLAVRWTLNLPDTLFQVRPMAPPDREAGWQFTGRGWGHGVGMCQAGAFGMAVRGHAYQEILAHYYTGIEIGPIERLQGSLRTAARLVPAAAADRSEGSVAR